MTGTPRGDRPGEINLPPSVEKSVDEAEGFVDEPSLALETALNRARSVALNKGYKPGKRDARVNTATRRAVEKRSGARADGRDPQLLGSTVERLIQDRGWGNTISVVSLMSRWAELVGDDVAEHCLPKTFDDGVLVIQADSSSWATQLKLLLPSIGARLDEELGVGIVESMVVQGPHAPSWRKGALLAPGSRGPRDTYG